ncbi:predicted protein [Naegleria gruberi]|uniref:Predicted protein n=1 Tax=Naegleria gruberi TaxID=5762 RepID=D2VCE8_NAEGR|nr:uncharacterized protein NAEGRDRAFT_48408 [Naegleria gruberi]EFC45292.1 predicted protein [Naegleria gruberi]|eukprot:XP_002678036.1 predicted protein [Naegleria gruberi strain NEG-M]
MSFRLARASVRIATTEINSKSFTVRDQGKRLSSSAQQLSESFHTFDKPIHLLSPLHRSNSHRFVRYDSFIHNEECRKVFLEFLQISKCEELVLFWEELHSYKECYKQFYMKLNNKHGTIYSRGFDPKKKQKLIFNLVERATFIVNTYLTPNSLLELNLHSKHRVHAPKVIDSINNRLRVEKDVFEMIRETQEETQELLIIILNELNPKYIFGDVEATVNLDLKDQLQSHFLKSEIGAKFVKSKGEEFFNNLSKSREQEQVEDEFKDLVMSLSSLKSKLFQNHMICDSLKKNTKLVMFSSNYSSCISDDDIYSTILWERDDSEWTSFHKNYDSSHKFSYNLSLSKSWTISQSFHSDFVNPKHDPSTSSFRVGRVDMIIPFEREKVFHAFSQPDIRKYIEEALDISLLESYTQDSLDDLDDASDCVVVSGDDFSEIIDVSNDRKPKGLFTSKCSMTVQNGTSILQRFEKKKVYDMNHTTLYDSELDCIIHVSKSIVKDSKSDNLGFSHFFFYRDNESGSDSTYMVHLFNLEKKRIDSKFKMKQTIKSRVKRVKQTFHNYFSKHSDVSDLLRTNDPLYIVNTLLLNKFSNPHRSWYRELLKETKSINFQKELKSNFTLSCESLKNNTSF